MKTEEQIKARIAELVEERRQIVDGEESYGESDPQEVEILEARIFELEYVLREEGRD